MLELIWSIMQTHAMWIFVCIVLVTIAMLLDLLTGIRKANSRGSLTTSIGLRRTVNKATKYYLPILCCSILDLLLSPLEFYSLPYLSIGMSAYCILCEVKSVFENTRERDEIEDMAKFLTKVIKSKDDSNKLLEEIIKNMVEQDVTKTKENGNTTKP